MLSGISERIQKIMDAKGINKSDLARIINVDRSYASRLTTGDREPSDRTISDICREFGVNEGWLRTGEGAMYIPKSRSDQLVDFFGEILDADDNDFLRSFCMALASLDKEQLHQLADLSEAVLTKWTQLKEKRETEQKEKADP